MATGRRAVQADTLGVDLVDHRQRLGTPGEVIDGGQQIGTETAVKPDHEHAVGFPGSGFDLA